MPGFVLHVGAQVMCLHGGQATPTTPNPRVAVSGQSITTMPTLYTIAGCPLVPPPLPPCVTAQWITAATRVVAGGAPVLLFDSQAICTPTGTGVVVLSTQMR